MDVNRNAKVLFWVVDSNGVVSRGYKTRGPATALANRYHRYNILLGAAVLSVTISGKVAVEHVVGHMPMEIMPDARNLD